MYICIYLVYTAIINITAINNYSYLLSIWRYTKTTQTSFKKKLCNTQNKNQEFRLKKTDNKK